MLKALEKSLARHLDLDAFRKNGDGGRDLRDVHRYHVPSLTRTVWHESSFDVRPECNPEEAEETTLPAQLPADDQAHE